MKCSYELIHHPEGKQGIFIHPPILPHGVVGSDSVLWQKVIFIQSSNLEAMRRKEDHQGSNQHFLLFIPLFISYIDSITIHSLGVHFINKDTMIQGHPVTCLSLFPYFKWFNMDPLASGVYLAPHLFQL